VRPWVPSSAPQNKQTKKQNKNLSANVKSSTKPPSQVPLAMPPGPVLSWAVGVIGTLFTTAHPTQPMKLLQLEQTKYNQKTRICSTQHSGGLLASLQPLGGSSSPRRVAWSHLETLIGGSSAPCCLFLQPHTPGISNHQAWVSPPPRHNPSLFAHLRKPVSSHVEDSSLGFELRVSHLLGRCCTT
jgi:hypothetical protein